jgi:hypothetical protein
MGKTYIFFEPKDEIFFERLAGIYSKLIKKYYNDAEKAYTEYDTQKFYNNYVSGLIFPACDYNSGLP